MQTQTQTKTKTKAKTKINFQLRQFASDLIEFGLKQALSCIFPLAIFLSLAITKVVSIEGLPRYDLLLVICLLVQAAMYFSKLETLDEVKVILVFHAIGLLLELFKTQAGSWAYPDFAYSKIGEVPLYSGFLYSSVASYMCQAWRRFDLKLIKYPPAIIAFPFGLIIYANFFTEHFICDLRWILMPLVFIIFWQSRVEFLVAGRKHLMPLAVSFLLIGLFVWFAENISTFLNAWQYPYQNEKWCMVHSSKISSWFLLVIISFIVVAQLKHVKGHWKK